MTSKYGKVEEVIDAFSSTNVNPSINKNGTIHHHEGRLYSYNVCIAMLCSNGISAMVNNRRYSQTTTRHSNSARQFLRANGWEVYNTYFDG